eukprot:1158346-Pelagomonas_calceolata.AAC.7
MPNFRLDGRMAGSGQELPAKLVANCSAAPATASHAPLTLQGRQAVFFGRVAKVSGRGVLWVGQGDRCELHRGTGKPRGSRPMNGASPKNIFVLRINLYANYPQRNIA